MSSSLQGAMQERSKMIVGFLEQRLRTQDLPAGQARLLESMRYSLLQDGGKRFRPVLAVLVAEALGASAEKSVAYGAAVECVHCYSLIHDDLPAMDDDDERRGQPTNHKVYGEDTAILAGDALLTEAFSIIVDSYADQPREALEAVRVLAHAAGIHGMVGGQAIDMRAKSEAVNIEEVRHMHRLKTGALIRAAAVGSAVIVGASKEKLQAVQKFSESLGLAFQIADDLLDYVPENPEPGSYPTLLGADGARTLLSEVTEDALNAISDWPGGADRLREIARYNHTRTV